VSITTRPQGTSRPSLGPRRRGPKRWLRLARAGVLGAAVVLAGWAGVGTLTMPGSASLGVKFVEWVRGHGGASFVAFLENSWYAINQPPTGGTPPKGALSPAAKEIASATGPLPPPARVVPFAKPPLPNEGVWAPEGPLVHGVPTMYVTLMRPDPVHTSLVAGVAWMDTRLLRFIQYGGAQEPPGGYRWPYMGPIVPPVADYLVAAFNSGFRLQDANGGYYAYGHLAVPLRDGAASFVISDSGVPSIEVWHDGNTIPRGIAVVRQNLIPLIENGHINPLVYSTNFQLWGATVGNQLLVWRSGVGITPNGALVYVSGPGLSVASLARLLQRVGAVNAMEFDINSDWTDFFYFNHQLGTPASPANGYKLVYDMLRPPQRYFEGTARDFVVAEVQPSLAR